MRDRMIWLLTTACCLASAKAQEGSVEAAAAARAAWSPETRLAFGFEDARFWTGGETVTEPRQAGAAAVRWARHKANGSLVCQVAPLDLSAFNTVSFWLHSSHANNETVMLIAESQREAGSFSYYSRKFTVDWTGWKQVTAHFRSFGAAREPAGWQAISRLRFSTTGWEQDATDESVWVLDELEFSYDPKPYRPAIKVEKYLDEPDRGEYLARLRPGHPRLILTDEGLAELRARIADDPLCAKWYEATQRRAAELAGRPVRKHELPDGRRLLSISRDVLDRIYNWALLYRLEGDQKWFDRAWEELRAVVDFPDWNPNHYLDTAEMMHAVAIGYDWFYHALTPEQRTILREGLWHHGLRLSHAAYLSLPAEGQQHWHRVTNNWNFVCNGGSALAAMALLDELPEECTEILDQAYQYIQIPLQGFEPDGAWWEGVGYWAYSMRYLLSYLRGLETAFGTDFGFVEALTDKGFAVSGDFPIYLTSPRNGFFNFADSGSGGSGYQHWAFFYLAARYRNPLYLNYQRDRAPGSAENLIYYEPFEVDTATEAPLDRHFRGAEVATMRSSWTDPNAAFVGIKAGRNGIAHAHQDLGSFIYYALGEKWIMDLGTEAQTYQSHKHRIPSLNFYRIRAEGHNTLVFNPAEACSQERRGGSTITRFETTPAEALAIVDLTGAYTAHATSVTRGFRFFNQRRSLLIQDEIRAAGPNEVYWFAHGDANTKMEVQPDGRTVLMERNGKLCEAVLLAPADARFTVMPAQPLPTSPNPDIQQKNQGISKLTVHLTNTKDVDIAVMLTARMPGEPATTVLPTVEPLAAWRLAAGPAPRLAGLAVDGAPLADFSPDVFDYTVTLPEDATSPLPVTAAAGSAGTAVQVEPAIGLPGTARVTVGTGPATVYQVRFQPAIPPGGTDKPHFASEPAQVGGITVTASQHDGNLPASTLDDDPETRWSASGHHWIAYDFGQPRRVEAVRIAWYNGHQRESTFRIETSAAGETWRSAFEGRSSGQTSELETYQLAAPEAHRHLRIVCFGNSQNDWNSITTVKFLP